MLSAESRIPGANHQPNSGKTGGIDAQAVNTAAKAGHFARAFQDLLIVFNNFLGSFGAF